MTRFFIKKIWQNEIDDSVHSQFVRFSKGSFENRALIVASRNGSAKVRGTFDLANEFVKFVSNIAEKLAVSGIILSKIAIDDKLGEKGAKKGGMFSYSVEKEISSDKLKEIAVNAYAMLLDCNAPGIQLKIKKKLPRPSAKGAEKVNDKFCVLQLDKKFWPAVHDEFFFGLPDFKKGKVSHTYIIKEMIIPKGEKDFEKLRVIAKRKGKIIRKATLDNKESVSEKEIVV